MHIQINAQSISRRKPAIHPVDMELKKSPADLRELICLCVEACVDAQRARLNRPSDSPLTEETILDMAQVGKIAFGADASATPADLEKARENALQSYEDGLYRVFLNGREIQGLYTALHLTENDTLTFIRLTMLAGTPWRL